jgi:hypothetical protein
LGRKRPQKLNDLRRKLPGGLPDHGEAAKQVIVADEWNREQARYPARTRAPRTRLSAGAAKMSGTWIGSCISRSRPVAPSPLRTGVASIVSTISVSRCSVARGTKTLALLVVLVDDARVRPESCVARATIVFSTVRRSRWTDRLADLAERPKLADRATEFLRPRLQLGQQAGVLDGDHRLIGECLKERDLVVGEPSGLRRVTEIAPIASSWRSIGNTRGSDSHGRRDVADGFRQLRIASRVRNIEHPAFANDPGCGQSDASACGTLTSRGVAADPYS